MRTGNRPPKAIRSLRRRRDHLIVLLSANDLTAQGRQALERELAEVSTQLAMHEYEASLRREKQERIEAGHRKSGYSEWIIECQGGAPGLRRRGR